LRSLMYAIGSLGSGTLFVLSIIQAQGWLGSGDWDSSPSMFYP
jgi:hypothetical protein